MTGRASRALALLHTLLLLACDEEPDDPLEPAPPSVSVLAEGAALVGSTNGIAFDASNRLFVANGGGQSISVLDPETGEIIEVLGPEHGVGFPDDLAFAPDGTLLWTDALTGEVRGWTTSGEMVVAATDIPSINPIAISDDGRVFVGQCFHEQPGSIFEVDPTGIQPPREVVGGVPGCAANGMDWWDGHLYVPRWFEGSVLRIDDQDGTTSDVTTDWSVPAAVALDSVGRVHAVSQASGEVIRIDSDTGARTVLATLTPGLDNLAFDASDRLFVSSTTDAFIVEVLDDGTTRTVSEGGMTLPMGVAVLGETLYVGEGLSIRSFNKNTGEALEVIRSVVGVGPLTLFAGPLEVWQGQLFVLDPFFGSAALLDPATTTSQNLLPFSAPVDSEPFAGGIAVTELGTGSVVLAMGADLSERTTMTSGLAGPAGLAAHGNDLYVSDSVSGEVLQIVQDAVPLATPEPISDTIFSSPEGIAVLDDTRLLVVEGGTGSLHIVHLDSGATEPVADDLPFKPTAPGLPPHMNFNDLHADSSGALYLNAEGAARIYKIE
ncbi:MAG: hypothetical protein ACRBN8_29870 [Nannocystales bacterium]